jgi:hypothetical protein
LDLWTFAVPVEALLGVAQGTLGSFELHATGPHEAFEACDFSFARLFGWCARRVAHRGS